ncbi:hypothetical protein Droror1_Dr00008798 [Drosera rotundifolia]
MTELGGGEMMMGGGGGSGRIRMDGLDERRRGGKDERGGRCFKRRRTGKDEHGGRCLELGQRHNDDHHKNPNLIEREKKRTGSKIEEEVGGCAFVGKMGVRRWMGAKKWEVVGGVGCVGRRWERADLGEGEVGDG